MVATRRREEVARARGGEEGWACVRWVWIWIALFCLFACVCCFYLSFSCCSFALSSVETLLATPKRWETKWETKRKKRKKINTYFSPSYDAHESDMVGDSSVCVLLKFDSRIGPKSNRSHPKQYTHKNKAPRANSSIVRWTTQSLRVFPHCAPPSSSSSLPLCSSCCWNFWRAFWVGRRMILSTQPKRSTRERTLRILIRVELSLFIDFRVHPFSPPPPHRWTPSDHSPTPLTQQQQHITDTRQRARHSNKTKKKHTSNPTPSPCCVIPLRICWGSSNEARNGCRLTMSDRCLTARHERRERRRVPHTTPMKSKRSFMLTWRLFTCIVSLASSFMGFFFSFASFSFLPRLGLCRVVSRVPRRMVWMMS